MQLGESHLPVIAGIGPSYYLELPAIAAGCLSGGLHAVRKGFDAVGIVVLAIVTGLGGGILRDVILGHGPPLAFRRPSYLAVALASATFIFFASHIVHRILAWLKVLDAAALGFFGVVGAQQAMASSLPLASIVAVGLVCAVGGGVVRDVLSNDIPSLLAPGTLYATVAIAGILAYVVCADWMHTPRVVAESVAIATTITLRLLAQRHEWHGPMPRRA